MSKLIVALRRRREAGAALLFLLPSLAGFGAFYAAPFGMAIVYSFTDRTIGGSFVGLDNYYALFASLSFRKAAGNTLLFTAASVPLLIAVSLGLAVILNGKVVLKRWLQTSFVLPLVVPVASIVAVCRIFLDWNGTLNAWLHGWGLERVDWLQSRCSMAVLAALFLWKNAGYNMILLLAGLQSIPASYYETARTKARGRLGNFGASHWCT